MMVFGFYFFRGVFFTAPFFFWEDVIGKIANNKENDTKLNAEDFFKHAILYKGLRPQEAI